jgi:hypothetical protein
MEVYEYMNELRQRLDQVEKRKLYSAVILGIVFVVASSLGIIYTQIEVDNQQEVFDLNATVVDPDSSNETLEAGIDLGEGLTFGRFNALFNKTKSLNLSSNSLTLVELESNGNISDRLNYEEEVLFEGNREIPIEMEGNRTGYFTGNLSLDIKTAENRWGEKWLRLLYNHF